MSPSTSLEPRDRVRVAIADDHAIFRDGLRRLLESEAGFEVVAEGADGEAAVRIAAEVRPDVLLLDVAMPGTNGLEALRAIDLERVRVILLTAALDPADVLRAVQRGARGVVLKQSATQVLLDGIRRVMAGGYLIGTEVVDDLAQAVRRAEGPKAERPYGLTARELEIVAAVAAGQSNREIAAALGISLQTVKHHLTSIFDKTGLSSRLELALLAIRESFTDPS